MKVCRHYTRGDGKARLLILVHQNGFFSFEEEVEAVDDVPELGPQTYWSCTHLSGLYESMDAAMRDAVATIAWLKRPLP